MSRVKCSVASRARRKKILKLASGYRNNNSCFRMAKQRVEKALQYAYRDTRNRKRDFRRLWIQRINAAVRSHGMTYSSFLCGLKKAGILLDRKMISEIAIHSPDAFSSIVSKVKMAISQG